MQSSNPIQQFNIPSDYRVRDFLAPVNVYVSHMTLYDFQELFFSFDGNENYTVLNR